MLYREHRFLNLPVFRDQLSRTFDSQVYASRDYHSCQCFLIFFHDPPELIGHPNPLTQKLESHNTWVPDIMKSYIRRAVNQGYGIMDVNIPKSYTVLTDRSSSAPSSRTAQSLNDELAIYLWENYIEPNELAKIILVGIGDAFHSLVHLINQRSIDTMDRLYGVAGFAADNPLMPVSSDVDPSLSSWYSKNSHIYVAPTHLAYDPDRRPPKRKFGHLIKSSETTLSKMMHAHADDLFGWIEERFGMDGEIEGGMKPPALNINAGAA